MFRHCYKCGKDKSIECFAKDTRVSHRSFICKMCKRKYIKEQRLLKFQNKIGTQVNVRFPSVMVEGDFWQVPVKIDKVYGKKYSGTLLANGSGNYNALYQGDKIIFSEICEGKDIIYLFVKKRYAKIV